MTGFIQRLLDRGNSLAAAPVPVQATARSSSPMAEHDQRLQHSEYREFPGLPAMTDQIDPLPSDTPRSVKSADRNQTQRPASRADLEPGTAKRPSSFKSEPLTSNSTVPMENAPSFDTHQAFFDQRLENPTEGKDVKSDATSEILKETKLSPPPSDNPVVPAPLRTTPMPPPPEATDTSTAMPPVTGDSRQTIPSAIPATEFRQPIIPAAPVKIASLADDNQNAAQTLRPALPETPPLPIDQMLQEHAPQTVQPAQRADPVPQPASEPVASQPEKTHTIEKTIREIQVPVEKSQTHSGPLTAHSVSKIGALSDRRRVHSLFGLRRR